MELNPPTEAFGTRRLSHSSRRSTLRLSVLDIALDMGVLSDDCEVAEWVFGPSGSPLPPRRKESKSRKSASLKAVVVQLSEISIFGRSEKKRAGFPRCGRSEKRDGVGLRKGGGGRSFTRNVSGGLNQVSGLVRKVSSYVKNDSGSSSSGSEEGKAGQPSRIRQTIKDITIFPPIGKLSFTKIHTACGISNASTSESSIPSVPPTPFILMTQMDMSEIGSALACQNPRIDASYMVVSQENAVLDVIPLSEAERPPTVTPSLYRSPTTRLPHKVRTLLNSRRRIVVPSISTDQSSIGSSRGTSDGGDRRRIPWLVGGIRRGRDAPFPVKSVRHAPREGVQVVANDGEGRSTLLMAPLPFAEASTDSLSVYSDDISEER